MNQLKLFLFGAPRAELNGQSVTFPRRKILAILVYLAVTKQTQRRDKLATLFWPESRQQTARSAFRRELAVLKAKVGEELFVITREEISLTANANIWLDVATFRQYIATSTNHAHTTETLCTDCLEQLTTATLLYTDDFLAGFTLADCPEFDDWQFFEADTLRREYADTLAKLVKSKENLGEFDSAIDYAQRWLALDPMHEPTHRRLMQLFASAGQQAAALRQYDTCIRILNEDLGLLPDEKTIQLYEAIRTRRFPESTPYVSKDNLQTATNARSAISRASLPRHNLPPQSTAFIGRQTELKTICQLLLEEQGCRLLTLIGFSGMGKTRLAIEAASKMLETFPDGVIFVGLALVDSPRNIVLAIADSLQFPLQNFNEPEQQLISYLKTKKLLLILDNIEHLVSEMEILTTFLRSAPNIKMLVTSHIALEIKEELLFPVKGMNVPETTTCSGTIESNPAVQLFVQSARHVDASFKADMQTRQSIAQICHLVEGMPLAIELAAAWIRTISCQETLAEIEEGFDFLTTTKRHIPEHHRSIRAVLEKTWQYLPTSEQTVLSKLAAFRGGFLREAAKEVVGATLPLLFSLTNRYLLYRNPAGRYVMHSFLRQFALEKIDEEQLAKEYEKQTRYFANYLNELSKKQYTSENYQLVRAVLHESDNLYSVWMWLLQQVTLDTHTELVYQFIDMLLPSWNFTALYRGYLPDDKLLLSKIRQSMQEAKWHSEGSFNQKKVFALINNKLGRFYIELGQAEEAIQLSQQALLTFKERGDSEQIAYAFSTLAQANIELGEWDTAEEKAQLSLQTALSDANMADPHMSLATISMDRGKYDLALHHFKEAARLYQRCHYQLNVIAAQIGLGAVFGRQHQFTQAITSFQAAIDISRQIDQKNTLTMALHNLGVILGRSGSTELVEEYLSEALALAQDMGRQSWQANTSLELGQFLLTQGDWQRSGEYLRAGLNLAITLKNHPLIIEGIFAMAKWQAHHQQLEVALTATGFVMANEHTIASIQSYVTEFWTALSSKASETMLQQVEEKLQTYTIDDILRIVSY